MQMDLLLFSFQDSQYMVAVKNHTSDNKSLLSFHKGDIICLRPMEGLGNGESWNLAERWS